MIMEMTESEPAGIWNLGPRCRSIFKAWEIVNVPCCAMAVKQIMPEAHTGITFIRHFTSSICWMLHNLHLFALKPF